MPSGRPNGLWFSGWSWSFRSFSREVCRPRRNMRTVSPAIRPDSRFSAGNAAEPSLVCTIDSPFGRHRHRLRTCQWPQSTPTNSIHFAFHLLHSVRGKLTAAEGSRIEIRSQPKIFAAFYIAAEFSAGFSAGIATTSTVVQSVCNRK
jgi:hypothetical protein